MKDAVQISSGIFSKCIELFNFLFCFFNASIAQVFKFFYLIYLIGLVFVGFLKASKIFFKLVPFDLASNLIIFHAVQNVLITLRAQRCVNLLIFHLLHKNLYFLYLSFYLMPLVLDNLYFGWDEVCFILESNLLQLFTFDVQSDTTAWGFEMKEMFWELGVLIILFECYPWNSFACIDQSFNLMPSKLHDGYLMEAWTLDSSKFCL